MSKMIINKKNCDIDMFVTYINDKIKNIPNKKISQSKTENTKKTSKIEDIKKIRENNEYLIYLTKSALISMKNK